LLSIRRGFVADFAPQSHHTREPLLQILRRDQKDPRFGLGLSATRTKSCARRDRLLLLAVLTESLLTLLGAASEASGLDRLLEANTSKKRQHSLFRQGLLWYDLMHGLPDEDIQLLMGHFDRMISEHQVFHQVFGVL
jgi:hypothetical protein